MGTVASVIVKLFWEQEPVLSFNYSGDRSLVDCCAVLGTVSSVTLNCSGNSTI